MGLASNYSQKIKIIDKILNRMSKDEKQILLGKLIKTDMELFFRAIQKEQDFLEKETGIDGAYLIEQTGCGNTSSKAWPAEELDIESVSPENLGKVSKEAENAWYCDTKPNKVGEDSYDGFLGYINTGE